MVKSVTGKALLERQANSIEATLAQRGVTARVTGGLVFPRWIRFQVTAEPKAHRWIETLADALAQALGADTCRVRLQADGAMVEIPRPDPQPVRLLPLQRRLVQRSQIPFGAAVVGMSDKGTPLLVQLPSPQVGHVLIAGDNDSGKSTLARTIVASLALRHRRSQLSFVLIGERHVFGPLVGLPGLLRPVLSQPEETTQALQMLVQWMRAREQAGRSLAPRVVVVIDALADLTQKARPALAQLAQGHELGIHLVVCTHQPIDQVVDGLTETDFPLQLVGATSPQDTAGDAKRRPGDFVAVTGEQSTRFHAAYISTLELAKVVSRKLQAERGHSIKVTPRPTAHRDRPDSRLQMTHATRNQMQHPDQRIKVLCAAQPATQSPWLRLIEPYQKQPGVTLLGRTADNRLLPLKLFSPSVGNLFITGAPGSGKSDLVKAIIATLALTQNRGQFGCVLIGPGFGPLAGLPHLLRPVLNGPEETAQALQSLLRLTLARNGGRAKKPRIVVAISEANAIKSGQNGALQALAEQRGAAGVHLIVCTQAPGQPVARSLLQAGSFPVRLMGRAEHGQAVTGYAGTRTERLHRPGNFTVVAGGQTAACQAAQIPGQELAELVNQMKKKRETQKLRLEPLPNGGAIVRAVPRQQPPTAKLPYVLWLYWQLATHWTGKLRHSLKEAWDVR